MDYNLNFNVGSSLGNNAIFRYNFLMTLWEVAFSHFQRISTLFLIFIIQNLVNNSNARQHAEHFQKSAFRKKNNETQRYQNKT